MNEPRTEAGRALLGELHRRLSGWHGADVDIAAIEDEARRAALDEAIEAVTTLQSDLNGRVAGSAGVVAYGFAMYALVGLRDTPTPASLAPRRRG